MSDAKNNEFLFSVGGPNFGSTSMNNVSLESSSVLKVKVFTTSDVDVKASGAFVGIWKSSDIPSKSTLVGSTKLTENEDNVRVTVEAGQDLLEDRYTIGLFLGDDFDSLSASVDLFQGGTRRPIGSSILVTNASNKITTYSYTVPTRINPEADNVALVLATDSGTIVAERFVDSQDNQGVVKIKKNLSAGNYRVNLMAGNCKGEVGHLIAAFETFTLR